jgi:integrase
MTTEINLDELDSLSPGSVRPLPWGEFHQSAADWWKPPRCTQMSASHVHRIIRRVEALNLAREGEPPRTIQSTADLTVGLIGRYVLSRPPQSPFTLHQELSTIRALCSFAVEHQWLSVNPFTIRPMARWVRTGRPRGKRHLSRDEIRRLLDELRAGVDRKKGWAQWRARRLYALTATIAYVGLRAREGQCLWVSDLDLEGGVINLVPHGTQSPDRADGDDPRFKTLASAQPVALPAALVPILQGWLTHRLDRPEGFRIPLPERIPWLFPGSRRTGPWTGGAPTLRPLARLKVAAKRAGVEGVTFQALRRSWATHAEGRGVPQALISRQCRHTDEQTTRRWYQQRDLEALKDAISGFDF